MGGLVPLNQREEGLAKCSAPDYHFAPKSPKGDLHNYFAPKSPKGDFLLLHIWKSPLGDLGAE